MGGRKIYSSGETAGYYVLSPFKLTIVRNSITLDNTTHLQRQYDDNTATIHQSTTTTQHNAIQWGFTTMQCNKVQQQHNTMQHN